MLLIGAGGLGSPLALYLAAAGVGRIGIVDFDVVDFSNLQRQMIHGTERRRPAQAGVGAQSRIARHQPARRRSTRTRCRSRQRERAGDLQALRRHRRRHRQLPDALPGQRRLRAAGQAERLRLASSASRGRRRSSAPRTGRATAASIPSRRRRAWCRGAPRAACSACCRASSAHPGDRDGQADPRHRRAAGRPAAALRRARRCASAS